MRRAALASPAVLAAGAAFAATAWAVRGRSSNVFGPSVWRVPPGHSRARRPTIGLTFDDGPSPATLEIIELLGSYQARATFFQCGANVERAPELSAAVSAGGHEIGNHTQTHPNCALRGRSFIHDEFARAQEVIARASGQTPVLMRPPFGVRWFGFRQMQHELGLLGVMWTVIGLDWKLPAAAIAERVLSRATDGAIICLHDGRGTLPDPDARSTVEATKQILPALLERGYHFETVCRLICPMTN